MKSHPNDLLQIALGILKDFQVAYPECRGIDRDKNRLTSLVKDRGIGVFGLDLPARLDAFLRGLETGRLDPKGTLRYSKEYPVPRLFAGLYMRVFDKDLCLKQDPCINSISFLIQLLRLGKKLEIECTPVRRNRQIEEYFDVERELFPPTLAWRDDDLDPRGVGSRLHLRDFMVADLPLFPGNRCPDEVARTEELLDKCQRVADIIIKAIGPFDCYSFAESRSESGRSFGFRHGPGAVAERGGRWFDKNTFPHWTAKLETWFPFREIGAMPNDPREKPRNHEVPSRLIAVPKTLKGPRLIAAEPSEHQFCQQQMLAFFVDRFHHVFRGAFITLKDQRPSQEMTKSASLDKSLATVDLSSASDRLTCRVVERIFRRSPTLLHSMHAARTRYVKETMRGRTTHALLRKFASQGTAVTFPVQSLVFLCCALACSIEGDVTWAKINSLRHKVRVFGDDIILPSTGYADLVSLLTTLQLKVNVDKSFVNGHFRESCGMYAYKGYDVTPVSPKTTRPDDAASRKAVLDISNNLFYKGYWHATTAFESTHNCIPFFRKTIAVGRDAVADGRRSFVRFQELLDTAPRSLNEWDIELHKRRARRLIRECLSYRGGNPPVRWNGSLQRLEVRTWSIRTVQKVRLPSCGYSALLQFSIAEPRSGDPLEGLPRRVGVAERPRVSDYARWEALSSLT